MKKFFTRKTFTLVEFIIVIVLLSIIAGVALPLLLAVNEGWVFSVRRNNFSQGSLVAINRMIREIREVKDFTSVLTATSSSFEFVNIDLETIRYSLSAKTLQRKLGAVTNNLLDNVSALTFIYYDQNGAVIVTPKVSPLATDIRRIKVGFTLSLQGSLFSTESQVSPRRLQ